MKNYYLLLINKTNVARTTGQKAVHRIKNRKKTSVIVELYVLITGKF